MHDKHHHRKGEMEHHKERSKHKSAHHSKMSGHHADHPKMHEHGSGRHSNHHQMIDNRMIHSSRQEGISRVMQKHGDLEVGQHGKMGMHHAKDGFKRHGGGHTPQRG